MGMRLCQRKGESPRTAHIPLEEDPWEANSPSKSQLPGLERKTISTGQQDARHPEGPVRVSVKILAENPRTSPHKPGSSPADTCCVSRASEAAE